MTYITSLGSSALSDFRRKALANQLRVKDVRARWVHYVALDDGHTSKDYNKYDLDRVLTYGDEYLEGEEEDGENTTTWFIHPRKGTISPWSSKATSIAELCGFGNVVKRIERGTIVKIISDEDFDVAMAREALHDRMTQDLCTTMPDLETMFGERYVTLEHFLPNPCLASQHSSNAVPRLLQRLLISSLRAASPKKLFGRPMRLWDWRSMIQRLNTWSPNSRATADWGGLLLMWSCICLLRSIQVTRKPVVI